jgi:hypothetical protein
MRGWLSSQSPTDRVGEEEIIQGATKLVLSGERQQELEAEKVLVLLTVVLREDRFPLGHVPKESLPRKP